MKFVRLIIAALAIAALATGVQAQEKKKLVVATEGAYPPYNFVAADGILQGFDVDFAHAICDKINAECEIIKQDWDGMIPGLIAKKYDVIIASMGILPEREEKIDFSIPYYQARPPSWPIRLPASRPAPMAMSIPEALPARRSACSARRVTRAMPARPGRKAEIVIYENSPRRRSRHAPPAGLTPASTITSC